MQVQGMVGRGAPVLDDARWRLVAECLPPLVRARARNGERTRAFLEAVLWVAMHRAPWGYLPPDYGAWHTVYVRFTRWVHEGIWDQVLQALNAHPDLAEPIRWLLAGYRATRYPVRSPRDIHPDAPRDA
jgi:transposase